MMTDRPVWREFEYPQIQGQGGMCIVDGVCYFAMFSNFTRPDLDHLDDADVWVSTGQLERDPVPHINYTDYVILDPIEVWPELFDYVLVGDWIFATTEDGFLSNPTYAGPYREATMDEAEAVKAAIQKFKREMVKH